jgi:hypothetical protein
LGHGVGWLLGDPDGKIPTDAPLHSLLLAASRLMGAFHVNTMNQAGVQISPAGLVLQQRAETFGSRDCVHGDVLGAAAALCYLVTW